VTDLVSAAVVIVVVRSESCDDLDAELFRRLLDFGGRVWVHCSGLPRGDVYDEVGVIVFPNGYWKDSHSRTDRMVVEWPMCECEGSEGTGRPQKPPSPSRADGQGDAGLT